MIGVNDTNIGRLILVRHGESEGNRDRRFTHSTEVPLTERGREQARTVAATIRKRFAPACVVASPFARARETGEIIAAALALPLEIEPDVCEQHLGALMGQPYDTVRDDPSFDPTRRWEWRPPGGESLLEVQARVGPVLDRLARSQSGGDVVVVAHAGVLMAAWAYVARSWDAAPVAPAIPNAGIVLVEHNNGAYRLPVRIEEA
ncbi:MAG: histidine phosphatase family protein [Deltaproteobacteria bacterium]|nr:histidine phosphatase family protein [Deltaproteobacteria bacterium]MBI3388948.1 histidine phosphatase family protein [Deltaproteobacteria bacterium]